MPHSPYTKTVQAPIRELGEYTRDLNRYRAELDEGDRNKYAAEELLGIAEDLLEHCEFLEVKLDIKKRTNAKLQQSLQTTEAKLENVQEQLKQTRDEQRRSLEDASKSQPSTLNTGPQSASIESKPESTTSLVSPPPPPPPPPQHDPGDTSKSQTPTTGTMSWAHENVESVVPQKRKCEDN